MKKKKKRSKDLRMQDVRSWERRRSGKEGAGYGELKTEKKEWENEWRMKAADV